MIFYDAAKNSTDVERYICESLSTFARNLVELKTYSEQGENIYKITITVEQIEPKL